jgi:ABC-type branched-subunit amino acid transport system ATPase component
VAALLELEALAAGYGGGDILRGLDLRVEAGGITCIVGPNGAGKSTVLRVVSGILKPRQGDVRFLGRSIRGASPRQVLALGIVQVPQDRSLFPTMTVRENVRLGGYSLRDRALVERRLREVAETFPIVRERGGEPAASLSGGQQRLVEFARAMMLSPRLLMLDEPSLGLDPRTRTLVFDMIGRLSREGRTLLLVEQNARSGLRLASHGAVMEGGRVVLEGGGPEVLANPEIGRLYLGRRARASTGRPDGGRLAAEEGGGGQGATAVD